MIKTYKANTNVSINVVLPGNKNLHVTFTPLSNGSSTYTTDNETIQKAIERHCRYGSLFRLQQAVEQNAAANDTSGAEECADKGPVKVQVSDLALAKDYLADHFGVSRTTLRNEKQIMEAAAAHGVEFEIN